MIIQVDSKTDVITCDGVINREFGCDQHGEFIKHLIDQLGLEPLTVVVAANEVLRDELRVEVISN